MHFAGVLVAEQRGRLAEAHRQVAVGAGAVQIDLILERAGHRAQSEAFLRLVVRVAENEHAVEVVVPVAGDLIQLALGQQRRLRQQIAALFLLVLDPALQRLDDARALRQQDGQALADNVDGREVFQLTAELVVVAPAGLLLLLQVFVQLLLLREGNAVDALEHLALRIAAPVSAAALRQLEGVCLDAAGAVQMRACAQVRELALRVERDDGVLGQVVDELDLIRLTERLHIGHGLGARLLAADEGSFSLQIFFISASMASRCSCVKLKSASKS